MSITEFLDRVSSFAGHEGFGGLVLMLAFLDAGYSLEQIVDHIVVGGSVSLSNRTGALIMVNPDGTVILPDRFTPILGSTAPVDTPTDTAVPTTTTPQTTAVATTDRPATTAAPTSPPTTMAPSTAPQTTATPPPDPLTELIQRAAGEYGVTTDNWYLTVASDPEVLGIDHWSGVMVIGVDGLASGTHSVTGVSQVSAESPTFRFRIDCTFSAAPLELLDDGLTFQTNASCPIFGNDVLARTMEEPVTGFVDVDLGQIVVGYPETNGAETLRFER